MKLGSRPWPRLTFHATALVFLAVAVYIYGFRFFAWLESDAAVPVLLADKVLHAKLPVVDDWYYANGELWVFSPHLLSVLPVALLGVAPVSLLVATATGFVLEVAVLVSVYRRFTREVWIAAFAAAATLTAWSNAHVAYAYIQLAYGFATCLYLVMFTSYATAAHDATVRPLWLALTGVLVAAFTAMVPARALVYVIAPILTACVWPWRTFALRRRLIVGAAALASWLLGFAIYRALEPVVAWSTPRGHVAFAFADWRQIKANVATFGRGLSFLCTGGGELTLWIIPGLVVIAGAIAIVGREVASRVSTALRWSSIMVIAQLGILVIVLISGNLLDGYPAVRYVIPSLLAMIGLAVVLAVRTVGDAGGARWRRVATGWLIAVPVAALAATRDVSPPAPVNYIWPDAAELELVADELVQRGLTHGFADNLAANLLTLDSKGAAHTCRVTLDGAVIPERWLASTDCYTAARLPDRFYVVTYQNDPDEAIRRLPPPIEQFRVGPTYEVHVFRTEPASTAWLELPIPDGERAAFPIRVPATHLQLRHHNATVVAGDLVLTGEPGTVIRGPYIDLPKGDYIATWEGTGTDSDGTLTFTVTGFRPTGSVRHLAAPKVTLDARALPRERSQLVQMKIAVKRSLSAVDFRIATQGGARVTLHQLVIERATNP